MGYELWTSPITGYRRKGTRLEELRAVLGAVITARAILEPLQCCSLDAACVDSKAILERRGFDVAGVKAIRRGPVVGFVERAKLVDDKVNKYVSVFTADDLISDSTPLGDLLKALHKKEYVFVLVGQQVKGIVTRADLNKPMVRVYLFGLVSLLEMHLSFWVRKSYANETWSQALKPERLEAAKKLQAERKARNEEITLFDCLQFCDKRDLFLEKERLREKLGMPGKKKAEQILKRAEDLRNRLAHSQTDLVQGSSWQELIELGDKIEELVSASDEAIESDARSANENADELWSAA